MRIKLVTLVVALVLFASPVLAFDFELLCPSAAVTPGASMNVIVTMVENWDPYEITLNRYASGFIVNATDSIGGTGFYGPFVKTTPVKTVPAATFDMGTTPGTIPQFAVVAGTVPPAAAGKLAMVFVSFLTSRGQEIGGGACMVNVAEAPQ